MLSIHCYSIDWSDKNIISINKMKIDSSLAEKIFLHILHFMTSRPQRALGIEENAVYYVNFFQCDIFGMI